MFFFGEKLLKCLIYYKILSVKIEFVRNLKAAGLLAHLDIVVVVSNI